MSEVKPSWRLMLFRTAIAFVAIAVMACLFGIAIKTIRSVATIRRRVCLVPRPRIAAAVASVRLLDTT